MVNFADFQDQRWLNRQRKILEDANYVCEYSGNYHKDVQVHICYYPRDKRLWEFPDNAFKCYCRKHCNERRNVEDAIKEILAVFSIDELDSLLEALKELSTFPEAKRAQTVEQLRPDIKNKRGELEPPLYYEDEEEE